VTQLLNPLLLTPLLTPLLAAAGCCWCINTQPGSS
jgi:hypothetical protein